MEKNKKTQIAGLDLIVACLILLLLLSIAIVFMLKGYGSDDSVYSGKVIDNIQELPPSIDFLDGHTVDMGKLPMFTTRLTDDYLSVKSSILNNSEYPVQTSEICAFIMRGYLGVRFLGPGPGPNACTLDKPCGDRKSSISYVKPVIYGPVGGKQIVNLYVVVCT